MESKLTETDKHAIVVVKKLDLLFQPIDTQPLLKSCVSQHFQ
jgi:hypothetical protein